MKLKAYLSDRKITLTAFAEMVGVTTAAAHRWVHGARIPRPKMMAEITKVTDGAVQPSDFYLEAAE